MYSPNLLFIKWHWTKYPIIDFFSSKTAMFKIDSAVLKNFLPFWNNIMYCMYYCNAYLSSSLIIKKNFYSIHWEPVLLHPAPIILYHNIYKFFSSLDQRAGPGFVCRSPCFRTGKHFVIYDNSISLSDQEPRVSFFETLVRRGTVE